jgi:hypothetical protein
LAHPVAIGRCSGFVKRGMKYPEGRVVVARGGNVSFGADTGHTSARSGGSALCHFRKLVNQTDHFMVLMPNHYFDAAGCVRRRVFRWSGSPEQRWCCGALTSSGEKIRVGK